MFTCLSNQNVPHSRPMYAAPRIYDNLVVAEPSNSISMYKMEPIHDDIPDNLGSCSIDLEARQDKCLSDLDMLMKRLDKIQVTNHSYLIHR